MHQCDSFKEIFTCAQLPTFFWQTNSDEVVNKHHQSLLYFQCSRSNILQAVSHIFAKKSLFKYEQFLRTFERKFINKLRTSSMSKSYLALIKKCIVYSLWLFRSDECWTKSTFSMLRYVSAFLCYSIVYSVSI